MALNLGRDPFALCTLLYSAMLKSDRWMYNTTNSAVFCVIKRKTNVSEQPFFSIFRAGN
jgi:hypothetical protein